MIDSESTESTEDKENEDSSDSSSEENDTDQTLSSEEDKDQTDKDTTDDKDDDSGDEDDSDKDTKKGKDRGYADDPRWQEREKDWKDRFNNQEQRHTDEIGKLRTDFEGLKPKEPEHPKSTKVPSYWEGDEESYRVFEADLDERISKAKDAGRDEVLKTLSEKTDAEQKTIQEATDYMNSEISDIEAENGVKMTDSDKNKLLKTVMDEELVDTKGRWNYKAGFKILKSQSKKPIAKKTDDKEDRKKLADATNSDKKSETKKSDVTTSDDFKNPQNRPW